MVFFNYIYNASYDVARVETVVEQSDGESGRHRAAPETERRNQIQKPLLRWKVCST